MFRPHFLSLPRIFGMFLVLFGLMMAGGGLYLVLLNGSRYYVTFGALLIVSGALVFLERRSGAWVYSAALLLTVAWSIREVGFHLWLLLPRLDVPLALGAAFLLPWTRSPLAGRSMRIPQIRHALPPVRVLKLASAVLLFAVALGATILEAPQTAYSAFAGIKADKKVGSEWPHYGNTLKGQRFAPVTQIDRSNVSKLEVAWTYRTGERHRDAGASTFEATPIKIRDTIYFCSPHNVVIALDADTGRERWRHDPKARLENNAYLTCRGVSYHESAPDYGGACPRRILTGTGDARLIAINADTGHPCPGFGELGGVDLKRGMGDVKLGGYLVTSAPMIYKNLAIVGGQIFERSSREPPGVVRAYDVITGALIWTWNPGYPENTVADASRETPLRASPNSWAPPSVDEALGLIYLPTSVQKPDAWGGNRDPKGEAFSSSVVALEAATGRVRWAYQTVHHDVWDWDVGAQPTLVDLKTSSGTRPALLAATKRGDIFVLDRATGEPIVPAPERPVPQGAPSGDWLSPTQPFSQLSFQPKTLAEQEMWGVSPIDQLWCRIQFRQYQYHGVFTPQTSDGKGIIVYPGNYGVFNWGGVAVDETRQLMIASPNSVAYYSRLTPSEPPQSKVASPQDHASTGQPTRSLAISFSAATGPFLSPLGIPCNAPPWGQVVAVDLVTNNVVWRRELGTTRDRAVLGLPIPLGVPSLGGPILTESGLVFIAAAIDDYLRAFDLFTGEEVWRGRLPAGGQATPITYVSEKSGRQFVVVSAGGHAGIGTTHGDSVVAFALPSR